MIGGLKEYSDKSFRKLLIQLIVVGFIKIYHILIFPLIFSEI